MVWKARKWSQVMMCYLMKKRYGIDKKTRVKVGLLWWKKFIKIQHFKMKFSIFTSFLSRTSSSSTSLGSPSLFIRIITTFYSYKNEKVGRYIWEMQFLCLWTTKVWRSHKGRKLEKSYVRRNWCYWEKQYMGTCWEAK